MIRGLGVETTLTYSQTLNTVSYTHLDVYKRQFNGNVNELGDIGRSPGKSYLFSLTAYHPEINLFGDRVQ